MVVGFGLEGSETVDLMSKGGESLVGASLPAVGAGAGALSGMDEFYFFDVMAA